MRDKNFFSNESEQKEFVWAFNGQLILRILTDFLDEKLSDDPFSENKDLFFNKYFTELEVYEELYSQPQNICLDFLDFQIEKYNILINERLDDILSHTFTHVVGYVVTEELKLKIKELAYKALKANRFYRINLLWFWRL